MTDEEVSAPAKVSFSEIASRAVAHAKFWRAFTAVVSAEAYDDLRESLLFELDLENTKLSEAESQAANRLKAEFVLVPSLDENDWRTVATRLSVWNAATAVFDEEFAKQIGNAIRASIIKTRSQSSDWTHAVMQSVALNWFPEMAIYQKRNRGKDNAWKRMTDDLVRLGLAEKIPNTKKWRFHRGAFQRLSLPIPAGCGITEK